MAVVANVVLSLDTSIPVPAVQTTLADKLVAVKVKDCDAEAVPAVVVNGDNDPLSLIVDAKAVPATETFCVENPVHALVTLPDTAPTGALAEIAT